MRAKRSSATPRRQAKPEPRGSLVRGSTWGLKSIFLGSCRWGMVGRNHSHRVGGERVLPIAPVIWFHSWKGRTKDSHHVSQNRSANNGEGGLAEVSTQTRVLNKLCRVWNEEFFAKKQSCGAACAQQGLDENIRNLSWNTSRSSSGVGDVA